MLQKKRNHKQQIINEVESYVTQLLDPENLDIKAHDWKHAFRVRNWAFKIAKGEGYKNPFLVEIASLLHDIGRLQEKELKRPHAPISGEMAREYLQNKNWLSQKESEDVIYAITNHSKGGNTQLTHILQDADRLDGFGAIGIIRTLQPKWYLPDYDPVTIVNPFTLTKRKVDDILNNQYGKELVLYAVDLFGFSISWYDRMNTKTGKELGEPLVEYTRGFLEEFKKEVQDKT